MKTILVTGGCGFIGSHMILRLVNTYQDYHIVNLDALTYAANKTLLKSIENKENYTFVHENITNFTFLKELFKKYQFSDVIHLAAESHVDNSIHNPSIFINTNINGTFNLLECAKQLWLNKPFEYKDKFNNSRFLHVSTDEVYGSLGTTGLFEETTPYAPNSPYSASKASSDFLVRSYNKTYGLNTIITNCSNNYGPHQHNEKLIPTIIRNALEGNPIPIYGDGKNIRDWLYVTDHCYGIDLAFHNGIGGETYNIGGNNEYTNIEIATKICEILDQQIPKQDSYKNLIKFVEDRAGHDRRYAIDASKIETELNWKAIHAFSQGIEKTVEWYTKLFINSSESVNFTNC